ncbi:MAG: GNAT family N-acetyltransferase [Burkholderiaceae bacterium]
MLSDALRSELIFLLRSGSATRLDDCLIIRTPDNPTYWWGNTLFFDRAPIPGDFPRWRHLFEAQIRAAQPASLHTTFGWTGRETGYIEPFIEAGFEFFETLEMIAERSSPIEAPHPYPGARIAALGAADWIALKDLLVETRDPAHSCESYSVFVQRRIDAWRVLSDLGQGAWFGAWLSADGVWRLVSALGVFVEASPGVDGRRIGRFQNVVTHPSARRQGLAGTLVATAAHYAFAALAADTLLILADEHDVARRIYAATGFRTRGKQCGLELAGYSALATVMFPSSDTPAR